MRHALLLAAALALVAGCKSSDPDPGPGPATGGGHRMRLDEAELKAAGDALSEKLAALADIDPKQRIRVERLQNLTGHRLDMNKLLDEARRRLVESNKYNVATDPERAVDCLLVGEVHDNQIKLQVVDAVSDKPILTAVADFK